MNTFKNRYVIIALGVLVSAAAQAATTNTTLTVTATVGLVGTSISATGTADLSGIGSGTFSASVPITSINVTSPSFDAPFTIVLSAGNLTGTITLPTSLLAGTATSGSGSARITGGTSTYSGATGSFPSLTGSVVTGATVKFTGDGTLTTGGTTGPPIPTITAVADAAAYSSNIAQGSIFIVKGTNLSATGYVPFSFPLPSTSGGVTINFTPVAGGTATPAYLIYTYNQDGVNQLAAVLPSTLAVGNYNVTVSNNGVMSAPFSTAVVQRKVELFTQDSSGSGLAVVQNFVSVSQLDVDRFTTGTLSGLTISPAKPGQVLIAWGTGLGPVTGGDNVASPGFNFVGNGADVKVIVGGVSITPAYAGRAPGLAGADQINFALPADIPTGCTVSFQVSVNGVLSAPTFISIAPSGSGTACVSPNFTTAQLQDFDNGASVTTGNFTISHLTETVPSVGSVRLDSATGSFAKYTGFQLAAIPILTVQPQIGPLVPGDVCRIVTASGSAGQTASGSGTRLDAGAITLNGPSGSNISNLPFTNTSGGYSLSIGQSGVPGGAPGGTIVAGTYTLNGAGGKDVGKFTGSVTLGTPLTVTGGLPATVTRSAGLTLNWTGGNPTDIVQILGYAGTGANSENATEFVCTTTAGAGTLTVPASILTQLPAVTSTALGNGTGSSFLEVASFAFPTSGNGFFSAPLTAGGSISNATFLGLQAAGTTPAYQ